MKYIIYFLIFTLIWKFSFSEVILYVSVNGTTYGDCTQDVPCTTIKYALAHCPSIPEECLIIMNDGVYSGDGNENLRIENIKLEIRAQVSSNPKFIVSDTFFARLFSTDLKLSGIEIQHGNSSQGVLSLEKSNVSISNTVFFNCYGFIGGAISSHDSSIDIRSSKFIKNQASQGAAIYANRGTITISNTIFESNVAHVAGGAIHTYSKLNLSGTNVTFVNNRAMSYGGAIYMNPGGISNFTDCSFRDSFASSEAGAIFLQGAGLYGNNCQFISNLAGFGGAIVAQADAGIFLNNSLISNNLAKLDGGSIVLFDQTISKFYSTDFVNNSANSGGAISVGSYSVIVAVSCNFLSNTAILGGAIFTETISHLNLTNCVFENNNSEAGQNIYCSDSTIFVSNCVLSHSKNSFECSDQPTFTKCTVSGVSWDDYCPDPKGNNETISIPKILLIFLILVPSLACCCFVLVMIYGLKIRKDRKQETQFTPLENETDDFDFEK